MRANQWARVLLHAQVLARKKRLSVGIPHRDPKTAPGARAGARVVCTIRRHEAARSFASLPSTCTMGQCLECLASPAAASGANKLWVTAFRKHAVFGKLESSKYATAPYMNPEHFASGAVFQCCDTRALVALSNQLCIVRHSCPTGSALP